MSGPEVPLAFDPKADEADLDADAMADLAAGRVVPHREVVEWLASWGTADELPCPEPRPR